MSEEDIGKVLMEIYSEGVIKREDLFITTKIWCDEHGDPLNALEKSLRKLQTDYIDLYLIHYPVTYKLDDQGCQMLDVNGLPILEEFDPVGLWKKMENLVLTKKARSIGVSNFGIYNLSQVINSCKIKPAAIQIEVHPYLKQKEILDFCDKNGITVVSFSSLGSHGINETKLVRNDKDILKIAKKHAKSPSQVILSYLVQNNICVIPKSTNPSHLRENTELVELDEEDNKAIDSIKIYHRYVNPTYLGKDAFR